MAQPICLLVQAMHPSRTPLPARSGREGFFARGNLLGIDELPLSFWTTRPVGTSGFRFRRSSQAVEDLLVPGTARPLLLNSWNAAPTGARACVAMSSSGGGCL